MNRKVNKKIAVDRNDLIKYNLCNANFTHIRMKHISEFVTNALAMLAKNAGRNIRKKCSNEKVKRYNKMSCNKHTLTFCYIIYD